MSDELNIGDENFVSSKRAAELSGYAQDYIGQLARKGLIEAKRVGGLWYVSLDSLNAYKSSADTYTPRPPQEMDQSADIDSIISFDGRDYISAARAARVTGYHPDYVGQLARSGKILSRQIGNRWYVDREAIVSHKREKDALLGAVQAESVGIASRNDEQPAPRLSSEPFFQYRTEGRDLIPKPSNDRAVYRGVYDKYAEAERPISIRRSYEAPDLDQIEDEYEERGLSPRPRKARTLTIGVACIAGIAIIASGVFLSLKKDAPLTPSKVVSSAEVAIRPASNATGILAGISDWFEGVFGRELTYTRSK